MFYAETVAGWRHQVRKHDAPELALPGLNPTRAHRQCHSACPFDTICLDFLPSQPLAWLISQRLNLGEDLDRLSRGAYPKGRVIL